MNGKTTRIMVGIIIVLIAAIGVMFFIRELRAQEFNWQYAIITDSKWETTMSDGGSYTDIYYRINFDDRKVRKYEDEYNGLRQKFIAKENMVYEVELDEQTAVKLQDLLNKSWNNGDANEGTYSFYTIEKRPDGSRYIHQESTIATIKTYTNKIDKLANQQT